MTKKWYFFNTLTCFTTTRSHVRLPKQRNCGSFCAFVLIWSKILPMSLGYKYHSSWNSSQLMPSNTSRALWQISQQTVTAPNDQNKSETKNKAITVFFWSSKISFRDCKKLREKLKFNKWKRLTNSDCRMSRPLQIVIVLQMKTAINIGCNTPEKLFSIKLEKWCIKKSEFVKVHCGNES